MRKIEIIIIVFIFGIIYNSCINKNNQKLFFNKNELPNTIDSMQINRVDSLFDYSEYTGYKPINGFIPNEEVAIKIAEVILIQIYGEKIYNEKPYNIAKRDSIWMIEGSLGKKYDKGGVFYIELNGSTGQVMKILHTK